MVEIRQPFFIGSEGVDNNPYPTGRHFIWPSSSVKRYNIKPMSISEDFNDITASDNVPIDFKITFKESEVLKCLDLMKYGFCW